MEQIRHLTHTGYHAGKLLCGRRREQDGQYSHWGYCPLHIEEFRATICPDCLKYVACSYLDENGYIDESETYWDPVTKTDKQGAPDWVREIVEASREELLIMLKQMS